MSTAIALLTLAVVVACFVQVLRGFRRIERQVTTANGRTVAELLDMQESRRIEHLNTRDKTAGDFLHQEHLGPSIMQGEPER